MLIEVYADAYKLRLGGTLLQHQSDGSWHPVAYFSRSTNPADMHITGTSWRPWLWSKSQNCFKSYLVVVYFKAVTDCSAVRTTLLKLPVSSGSSLVDYVTGVRHGAGVPTWDKDAACGCPE